MRIELPRRHERFGAVRIHELTQVVELDSGSSSGGQAAHDGIALVPEPELAAVHGRMAVVVPTKNERRKVIDGVLSGVPHDCLLVHVSASEREPIDRFELETEILERFCRITGRTALTVHQADPGLGAALAVSGLEEMLGDDEVARPGKGEAMVVGTLLGLSESRQYLGFVDADNYVPGAVHEYVKVFAASLHLATTPYAMVRISWQSKPKVEQGDLVFNRWGRTSQVTNRFLNALLSTFSGFGTEVIATGNSGEHAMTSELALRLRPAGGFAAEPYQFVDMFEQFGGALPSLHPEVNRSLVDVFQVETRNPHFHEDKGPLHVDGMRDEALGALCHSPICPDWVRAEIEQALASGGRSAPPPMVYPPLEAADPMAFVAALEAKAQTFRRLGD